MRPHIVQEREGIKKRVCNSYDYEYLLLIRLIMIVVVARIIIDWLEAIVYYTIAKLKD